MRKAIFAVLITAAFAAPASAGAIVIFDVCGGRSECGPWLKIGLDARHDGTGLPGGDVRVEFINTIIHGPNAFGFNIAGSHDGLRFFNLSNGYTVGGTDENINPFGTFEFSIDGPPAQTFGTPRLSFWIGRDGGFLDPRSVFALNEAGYLAAVNAFNFFDASQTFTAGADDVSNLTTVPEPGTMMLLATGLAAAWRARRSRSALL